MDIKQMLLDEISDLGLGEVKPTEDAVDIPNLNKVGKWVAFPHSRNRDKVAQISNALYDDDIEAPCFIFSGEHGSYRMKQNQVDAFFDTREEAEEYYRQENSKPTDIKNSVNHGLEAPTEDAAEQPVEFEAKLSEEEVISLIPSPYEEETEEEAIVEQEPEKKGPKDLSELSDEELQSTLNALMETLSEGDLPIEAIKWGMDLWDDIHKEQMSRADDAIANVDFETLQRDAEFEAEREKEEAEARKNEYLGF